MVTHDVESGRVVSDGPVEGMTPAETTENPKTTKWYVELPYVLTKLASAYDRAFIIIGVIAIGAAAVTYWGAYSERTYVTLGAMAIVGLAMLAWTVVTIRMLWVVATGFFEWRATRRSAGPVIGSTESVPE